MRNVLDIYLSTKYDMHRLAKKDSTLSDKGRLHQNNELSYGYVALYAAKRYGIKRP